MGKLLANLHNKDTHTQNNIITTIEQIGPKLIILTSDSLPRHDPGMSPVVHLTGQ